MNYSKIEFTYPSSDQKTSLHAVQWLPDKPPIAVLQIAHGITEHIMRYDRFACFMASQGFLVVGNDHIGHGHSIAAGSAPLYFGPEGSWKWAVQDIHRLYELTISNTEKNSSHLPYVLLDHSLGSFLVRHCLILFPGMADAAILMGTGQMGQLPIFMGKAAASAQARKSGEDIPNENVRKLLFESYNKNFRPNRTTADWLCSAEKGVDDFLADPLCQQDVTPGLFRELMNGMAFTCKWKNLRKTELKVPILFVSGGDDPVGGNGKGVSCAYRKFRQAGVQDVTMKLYPGLRHNLLDEDSWVDISQDICDWTISRLQLISSNK